MAILPSGPWISTLRRGSLRLMFRPCVVGGGSRTRNVTSGGKESGARPILERHWGVVEKCAFSGNGLDANAGTRKAGKVSSRVLEAAKTDRKALDERVQRAGEAIGNGVLGREVWSCLS